MDLFNTNPFCSANFFMKLLSVENLSILVKGKPILENVSFEVEQGDIFCVLGKNGSGKSTLLKSILGLYPRLNSGNIRLTHFNLQQTPRKIYLPLIGALIENASLYPHLTTLENLKVIASYYPNIRRTRIDEVLNIVGLDKERNKIVAQLSQGMKQRLGIAIAILHKPKLILLDEPTNALDPEAIPQLRNLILTLHQTQNLSLIHI
jgi:ABC-2 type transport system ATP-binding protein